MEKLVLGLEEMHTTVTLQLELNNRFGWRCVGVGVRVGE